MLITIRQRKNLPKAAVKMYTKRISIEDPYNMRQSLSRNLANLTSKYIINIIRKSCVYFSANTHSIRGGGDSSSGAPKETFKLIDRLIEETGIAEARKFSSCNDSDEEREDDESAQHDDDSDDSSSGGSTIGNESGDETEIEDENEDDAETNGVFVEYENPEGSNLERDLSQKMSKVKLASSESSSVMTSLEHFQTEEPVTVTKVEEEVDVERVVKQCIEDLIHSALSSFDNNMPNTNLDAGEITTEILKPVRDYFKFNASTIGLPAVSFLR
jgi:hypothetical protein